MNLIWPDKDPSENLDYSFNWRARVPVGDSIVGSTWVVDGTPNNIVLGASTYSTYTTTIWLSGGTVGNTYVLTNTITTLSGRVLTQSVQLNAVSK